MNMVRKLNMASDKVLVGVLALVIALQSRDSPKLKTVGPKKLRQKFEQLVAIEVTKGEKPFSLDLASANPRITGASSEWTLDEEGTAVSEAGNSWVRITVSKRNPGFDISAYVKGRGVRSITKIDWVHKGNVMRHLVIDELKGEYWFRERRYFGVNDVCVEFLVQVLGDSRVEELKDIWEQKYPQFCDTAIEIERRVLLTPAKGERIRGEMRKKN